MNSRILLRLAPVLNRLGIGWLFVLALAPGLLAGGLLFYSLYQHERAQLEEGALQTARALSHAVDRDLAATQGKLEILAASTLLRSDNLAPFYQLAQTVISTESLGGAIVLIDETGQQILNTYQTFGSPLPRTGHPEFSRHTFESGKPAISDLYIGGLIRRPFVAVEVPVMRAGKVVYALDMAIPVERLNRLLPEKSLPEGWVVALLDSQGTIIARSQNPSTTVGQKATPDLLVEMSKRSEGTKESHTLEGIPSFVAFTQSNTSHWTIVIGMARDRLFGNLFRSLAFAGLTIVGFLLGGIILAWTFSRNLRKALADLGKATEAATAGDLNAAATISGPPEVARLAGQFNRLQEARRSAEAATCAKSSFLANMSHELRTPLHVIMGLGYLLGRESKDPKQKERLDQLCVTSDHLSAIINDVLDFSKIEANRVVLEHSDFRLDAVVERVVRMIEGCAQEKGLKLETEVSTSLHGLALRGDSLRLAQILINLCSNAVKYTEKGTVRLQVGCLHESDDAVALHFAVEDTGTGLAPADLSRLFHRFEQCDLSTAREHGGTGLGLSISQSLVSLMGGHIEVDSELGKGSNFHFDLVFSRAANPLFDESMPPTLPIVIQFDGRRILLAEDNELSQDIIFEMLVDMGCDVDVASDGVEAVDCAQARNYDLILMDVQMPRMDGLAATRAIRMLPGHHDTPIIALTANAFTEDSRRCLEAGMNGHFSKPVSVITLAVALGKWLPELAAPHADESCCDTELSRALARIPGLELLPAMTCSPQHLGKYRDQLDRFVKLHGGDMAILSKYLRDGNNEDAHAIVHSLKGISGLVGARKISMLAGEIAEQFHNEIDSEALKRLVGDCEVELMALSAAVHSLPDSLAAPEA